MVGARGQQPGLGIRKQGLGCLCRCNADSGGKHPCNCFVDGLVGLTCNITTETVRAVLHCAVARCGALWRAVQAWAAAAQQLPAACCGHAGVRQPVHGAWRVPDGLLPGEICLATQGQLPVSFQPMLSWPSLCTVPPRVVWPRLLPEAQRAAPGARWGWQQQAPGQQPLPSLPACTPSRLVPCAGDELGAKPWLQAVVLQVPAAQDPPQRGARKRPFIYV